MGAGPADEAPLGAGPADDAPRPHEAARGSQAPSDVDATMPGALPETGDIVVDAALRNLATAPSDDLDAQLETGEAVHRTLQSRLTDLGG